MHRNSYAIPSVSNDCCHLQKRRWLVEIYESLSTSHSPNRCFICRKRSSKMTKSISDALKNTEMYGRAGISGNRKASTSFEPWTLSLEGLHHKVNALSKLSYTPAITILQKVINNYSATSNKVFKSFFPNIY